MYTKITPNKRTTRGKNYIKKLSRRKKKLYKKSKKLKKNYQRRGGTNLHQLSYDELKKRTSYIIGTIEEHFMDGARHITEQEDIPEKDRSFWKIDIIVTPDNKYYKFIQKESNEEKPYIFTSVYVFNKRDISTAMIQFYVYDILSHIENGMRLDCHEIKNKNEAESYWNQISQRKTPIFHGPLWNLTIHRNIYNNTTQPKNHNEWYKIHKDEEMGMESPNSFNHWFALPLTK